MAKDFYDYFKENMDALGLPAPQSLFGTVTAAAATIGAMAKYVEKYGNRQTVIEMARALPGGAAAAGGGAVGVAAGLGEVMFAIGSLAAAFYVGACIGSLAVAAGRSLSGGLTMADYFHTAFMHGFSNQTSLWLGPTLHAYPVLLGEAAAMA